MKCACEGLAALLDICASVCESEGCEGEGVSDGCDSEEDEGEGVRVTGVRVRGESEG